MVEQALQTVDGTPVIVSWVTFENEANLSILSGMTADVEIIGGEALDALLVPIQALREIAPGSYAVFIVAADGSLKLTPVTVGLRDFANAEILTGVSVGDVVSTGVVETK
jgi:multidrug efflux pump subunit AcrA (membrane-fusion protein)